MELLDLLKKRSSIRKFTDKKIEQEKIDMIIEAGLVAPTACNLQPQKIYVVQKDSELEKWRKCTHSHFNEQLVFIICYDKNICWEREYDHKKSGDIDGTIVTTQMMLEAFSLGISSTWVMHFMPEVLKKEFNIPDNLVDVAVLSCGYADSNAPISKGHLNKKDKSEIVIQK